MPRQMELAGVHSLRRGGGVQKYVNSYEASGSEEVIKDASIVFNLSEGKCLIITQAFAGIESINDNCYFKLVGTTEPDGEGDVVEASAHVFLRTGAIPEGSATEVYPFVPGFCVKYSSGIRSVTVQINANDGNCIVSCGYNGWEEKEV